MSGAVWVASYLFLCLTVLSLTVGMLLLYRRVQAVTLDAHSKIGRWPSPLFRPGDAPAALRRTFHAARLSGRLIVVVTPRTDDLLFAAVSAARDIARRYGLRCVLVSTTADSTATRLLPPTFDTVRVLSFEEGDLERLALIATPVTILWDDAVVDAAVGFLSPAQIERRFAAFLRPQAFLMPDSAPHPGASVRSGNKGLALALMPSNEQRPSGSRPAGSRRAALPELLSDGEERQESEVF